MFLQEDLGSATAAIEAFAEEPARALTRNAAVVAVGFLPLLFSSLTPYVIVGVFLATIIVLSWLATVVALPRSSAARDTRRPIERTITGHLSKRADHRLGSRTTGRPPGAVPRPDPTDHASDGSVALPSQQ